MGGIAKTNTWGGLLKQIHGVGGITKTSLVKLSISKLRYSHFCHENLILTTGFFSN